MSLAVGLGADLEEVPTIAFDTAWSGGPALEQWRDAMIDGPRVIDVVVAIWNDPVGPRSLVDQDLDGWVSTMEAPFALWFAALAVGSERCADGGQLVAVVDRTNPKDAAGWGAETAVADAVEVMARSFDQIHGHRGVRINLVTSAARLIGSPRGATDEVVRAVAMLLSNRGSGVTSTVIHLGGER
jgi:hypothetical protein